MNIPAEFCSRCHRRENVCWCSEGLVKMENVYVWSDGQWCYESNAQEYQWKEEDFEVLSVPTYQSLEEAV